MYRGQWTGSSGQCAVGRRQGERGQGERRQGAVGRGQDPSLPWYVLRTQQVLWDSAGEQI